MIGLHPVGLSPVELARRSCRAGRPVASSLNALWILPIRLPPAIGQTTCCGDSPAELLGDLEAERLRSFGVEGPQVDVDEAPAVLERHLRAEAVDLVVGATHLDDLGPVDAGAENLGALQVGGDEDVALQPGGGGVGGDAVGQVAGRGTADGGKAEFAALLSATATTRSLNDSVGKLTASFLIHSFSTPSSPGEAIGLDQGRAADLQADGRLAVEGQQFLVAPHGDGRGTRSSPD